MANRDPNHPPRDHTVAIIAGMVCVVALLVILAVGLELTKSQNTMAIIAALAITIGGGVIAQLVQLSGIKRNTEDIQHQLNGNFEPRMSEIVRKIFDEKFGELDLDARIRSGVTRVLHEREDQRDQRIREIVDEQLQSTVVACRVLVEEEQ